ncbi:hypothetical protein SAMN05192534_108135 [Alteribacillus persepolensis]|uniref:Nuclease-related domain-containing protein n=1 Tax=Alteribacillus persepolensis TaxID=568899 RepID=A0A1G8E443_9BACI|nr:NERD domain-containing protein [Alteribacillus persepolensis]SDH64708.1 hypothetical protein SAMN05192534_108135 [Alteribacillus persepolensis]
MAHLIKLEDCTSRYEHDIQRYASQFTRLKRERWQQMKRDWKTAKEGGAVSGTEQNWLDEAETNFSMTVVWKRLKELFKRQNGNESQLWNTEGIESVYYKHKTFEEIKDMFYDDLFRAQLRWASSSFTHESFFRPQYKYDRTLRCLLRTLPDNYMVLYYPVFMAGKAPIEADVIVISPTEVYVITLLHGQSTSVFETTSSRFWYEYVHGERKKRISPMLALSRMNSIAHNILQGQDTLGRINEVVIAPLAMIDHKAQGTRVKMVDTRNITQWFDTMKKHPSPIKRIQLITAKRFLDYTRTTAFDRLNMEDEEEYRP